MIETVQKKIIVRDLKKSHLTLLEELEQNCFSDPWPREWFRAVIEAGLLGWGAFNGRILVGYLVAIPEKESLHLANIAIDEEFRRCGIARTMIKRLYEYCRRMSYRTITLEVRESNYPALAFYKNEGFEQTSISRGYYKGIEDALNFKLELI